MDFSRRVQAPESKFPRDYSKPQFTIKDAVARNFQAPKNIPPPQNTRQQKREFDRCEKHRAVKVAFEPQTNEILCNICLYENSKTKQGEPYQTALFNAVITRDLKKKFDIAYNQFKETLCEVAEIEPSHVKDILRQRSKEFFDNIKKQVAIQKEEVMQKIKESNSIKQIEELMESNKQYFDQNAGQGFDRLKVIFEEKLDKGKFASIVKKKQFYEEQIDHIEQTKEKMDQFLNNAQELLSQTIQINDFSESIVSVKLDSILEDNIVIDQLSQDAQPYQYSRQSEQDIINPEMNTDDDLNQRFNLDQIECQTECSQMSLFNISDPSKIQFTNLREQIGSDQAVYTQRQMKIYRFTENSLISEPFGHTNLYFVKLAVIPGKNELYLIGGSHDIQCDHTTNTVQSMKEKGVYINRRPMAAARAKVGVCTAQVKGIEGTSQKGKNYIFAIGGQEQGFNTSTVVEKYNVLADIWQSMPSLVQPRANTSACVLSDLLYVFGGTQSKSDGNLVPLQTIERLNLRNSLRYPTVQCQFELIELQLPSKVCDIGVFPLSTNEALLLGGFSDNDPQKQKLKFSVSQGTTSTQQEQQLEPIGDTKMEQSDFFWQTMYRLTSNQCASEDDQNSSRGDKMLVFGVFFIHEIALTDNYPVTSHSIDNL